MSLASSAGSTPTWNPRNRYRSSFTQFIRSEETANSGVLQQRQFSERERYGVLKERVSTLERELKQELARRADAERQLQLHIDTELQSFSERMAQQMVELQQMVKSGMENLNRAVEDLSGALNAEQEQRKLDIDHVGTSLCARLDEVIQTVDEERFARLEQERQSLRRFVSTRW
jgi:SF-assemblin/beta giardin